MAKETDEFVRNLREIYYVIYWVHLKDKTPHFYTHYLVFKIFVMLWGHYVTNKALFYKQMPMVQIK